MFINTESAPRTFRTNPSQVSIYLRKIPTVITETSINQALLKILTMTSRGMVLETGQLAN